MENTVEKKVILAGLSCDSCVKLISRTAKGHGVMVKSADVESGEFVFEAGSEQQIGSLLAELEGQGYSQGNNSGQAKRAAHFIKGLFNGKFYNELDMMSTAFFALVISAIAQFLVFSYLGVMDVSKPAMQLVVFLDISLAAIAFSLWHFFSLRRQVPCMTGMMVGMTVGMMAGFLVGYVFGATNGMFIGSVIGMAVGMSLGAFAGKCCGVMGVMEGLMGGLMASTMGAMLAVMLLADNLMLFTVLLFATCLLILLLLLYMLAKEYGPVKHVENHAEVIAVIVAASLMLGLFAIIGPKGAISLG
ncbi:MAG: hypothetical protein WCX64_01880 [Candidatus Micrarchaeia archaeon]